MDLAYELAVTCVKSAADPRALREQFELSAEREGVMRRHADRWDEAAKARASEEDTSLGGYIDTGLSRALIPVPQTGTEALVRGGAGLAGGVAGYRIGKAMEQPDPLLIHKLFNVSDKNKAGRVFGPLALDQIMKDQTLDANGRRAASGRANALLKDLMLSSPEAVRDALYPGKRLPGLSDLKTMVGNKLPTSLGDVKDIYNRLHLPTKNLSGDAANLQARLRETLGDENLAKFKDHLAAIAKTTKDVPVSSKLPRYLGLAGGLGAAALGTGIPLALRALWQKGQGGEAAVRARNAMEAAQTTAESEAAKRDEILQQLGLAKTSALTSEKKAYTAIEAALLGGSPILGGSVGAYHSDPGQKVKGGVLGAVAGPFGTVGGALAGSAIPMLLLAKKNPELADRLVAPLAILGAVGGAYGAGRLAARTSEKTSAFKSKLGKELYSTMFSRKNKSGKKDACSQ